MNLILRTHIIEDAHRHADDNLGPQTNKWPEGSEPHHVWLEAYYARVKEISESCAA